MPNRASHRAGSARQTSPSPRDRLVAAAVALADREGLAAVSIRRVAVELALRPMSIYTYIASKDELLDLMAEAVVSEVLVREPPSNDWRAAVETIAIRSHQVFVAHSWLAAISQQRSDLGASAIRHAEQLLAAIAPLGLSAEEAWEVLFLINDYTLGHAQRVAHAPSANSGDYPPFDAQQFPHLAATLSAAPRRGDETFRSGLRRILDAIANTPRSASPNRARRASTGSPATRSTPESERRTKQNAPTRA